MERKAKVECLSIKKSCVKKNLSIIKEKGTLTFLDYSLFNFIGRQVLTEVILIKNLL